jgi:hypothetical protein
MPENEYAFRQRRKIGCLDLPVTPQIKQGVLFADIEPWLCFMNSKTYAGVDLEPGFYIFFSIGVHYSTK